MSADYDTRVSGCSLTLAGSVLHYRRLPPMTIKITMPQLGESVSEGVVGRWLKQVGERVERDEPLVEIITDKVNAEIPAVASGVLKEISAREGETVAVGTEIALLEEESQSV